MKEYLGRAVTSGNWVATQWSTNTCSGTWLYTFTDASILIMSPRKYECEGLSYDQSSARKNSLGTAQFLRENELRNCTNPSWASGRTARLPRQPPLKHKGPKLASRHYCSHYETCGSRRYQINGLPVASQQETMLKVTEGHLPLIVALNGNNCPISTSNRSTSERFRCVGKSKSVDKLILSHLEQI